MKYTLCARAGLWVERIKSGAMLTSYPPQVKYIDAIRAADVEKLLEGALKVYRNSVTNWSEIHADFDTETARLIMIEPIVKDTAESLLRELVEADMTPPANEFPKKLYDILERAKRILEAK